MEDSSGGITGQATTCPLRQELAAKDAELCALRDKLRASNFAQRALENRLLELERGGLIGGEVLSDWPETANPPVAVLDLDIRKCFLVKQNAL
jgi:hypothetical protein